MLNLDDVHLFVTVAELKSLTAAGDKEQLSKSTVSRRLRHLEDHLGVRLLERTTRNVHLTESGEEFYRRALTILDEVETTEQLIGGDRFHASGHLRICSPHEFTRLHLQYLLPLFAKEQPQLQLEVLSGTVGQHLAGDRLDLMIHIDEPEDSSFIARPITMATTNYYASPEYLERYGEPREPADVLAHKCVVESRNPRRDVNIWRFLTDDGYEELSVVGHYIADTTYLCRRWVEEGLGISMLPDHVCAKSVRAGRLRKLFDGRHEVRHVLYAVYPSRRYVPAKVRVFLEFLERELPERLV